MLLQPYLTEAGGLSGSACPSLPRDGQICSVWELGHSQCNPQRFAAPSVLLLCSTTQQMSPSVQHSLWWQVMLLRFVQCEAATGHAAGGPARGSGAAPGAGQPGSAAGRRPGQRHPTELSDASAARCHPHLLVAARVFFSLILPLECCFNGAVGSLECRRPSA